MQAPPRGLRKGGSAPAYVHAEDWHGAALTPYEPAPVRLLRRYDNLWLSPADRTRVAEPEKRRRWMGRNGGVGRTVFVDGMLEGLWRQTGGHVEVELFRRLTRAERADLDREAGALGELLATGVGGR